MTVTKFEICSRALVELGEEAISSFDIKGPATTCGLIYPEYIKYLLSIHPWKFTLKKVQLARLTTTPVNKWKYAYQLPSDMVIFRAFYNNNNVGARAITHYEIFENRVLTDEEEVYIDYQIQVSEENFPSYFTEFAIMALASKLAMTITDDAKIEERVTVKAWGLPSDNKNGGEFGVAKKLDTQQNPSIAIEANDLIAARFA